MWLRGGETGRRVLAIAATAAVAVAMPLMVQAQTSAPLSADRSRPDQGPAPAKRANLEAAAPPKAAPPASPTLAAFKLSDLEISGSSLPAAKLRSAYAADLGRTVTSADLSALSAKLAGIYAHHSDIALYTLVIPVQQPRNGVLHVEVTEGYILSVRIVGPPGRRDFGLLRHYAAALTAERPLRRSTLERYVSLIRDIPGLNASMQFVQASIPGALQLVITVRPRTLELAAGVDNRGVALLGRTQVEVDAVLHSLLREGDETHASIAFPTDLARFRYYALSHAQMFGGNGSTVQMNLGYISTAPKGLDLHGHATSLRLQVNAPVVRSYGQSLYATIGVDGSNSDNALLGQVLSDDRTRATRATLTYTRQNSGYFLVANGGFSVGFDGLGARVLSPELSDVTFNKLNLKLSVNFALPHDAVLRLDSAGQYTQDRLPGAEQFALGGEEFGRAYEAAAVEGDRGVAGSAELAWKLANHLPDHLRGSELYAFADGGQTNTISRLGAASITQTIASIGAGGRLALGSRAVVQVEADRGLTNPVATEDHEGWRTVFSVKSLF